jgi:hypothetical protein
MGKGKIIHLSSDSSEQNNYFKVNVNGDRQYSNSFDFHLISESTSKEKTNVQRLTETIYPLLGLPNYNTELRKTALNCTLSNLLETNSEGKYLAVSKSNNYYNHSALYDIPHYTYAYIVEPINKLIRLGYIEQHKGFYSTDSGKSYRTRINPTQKLLDIAEDAYNEQIQTINKISYVQSSSNVNLFITNDLSEIKKRRFPNAIILNDGKKKERRLVPFKIDRNVQSKIDLLNEYNDLADSSIVSIPSLSNYSLNPRSNQLQYKQQYHNTDTYNTGITPLLVRVSGNYFNHVRLDTYLYRVFNQGTFELGGRFYNRGYQKFNHEIRRHIRINGYETVEIDYSAYHLNMLYHKMGIDYKGDPYSDIANDDLRPLLKKVSLIAINESHRGRAYVAFENEIYRDEGLWNLYKSSGYKAKDLFELFGEKHKPIAKFFNKGVGLELQYEDSCIAEDILKHFTKKGIVCLPIHDSFIVESKYMDELAHTMQKVYKSRFGYDCKLKVEGGLK